MPTRALITFTVSPSSLDLLNQQFGKVTYIPPSESNRLPRILEALETAQVFLVTSGDLKSLPSDEEALGKVGKELRVVQLGSAGADAALGTEWVKGMIKSGRLARNEQDWRGRDPSGGNGGHREYPLYGNLLGADDRVCRTHGSAHQRLGDPRPFYQPVVFGNAVDGVSQARQADHSLQGTSCLPSILSLLFLEYVL